MGLLDVITGGKPKSMSSAQFDRFKEHYDQLVDGKFSWLDAIPPTNIPGIGGKIAMLSVKGLLSFGERGVYAGKTAKLHEELKTQSLGDIKFLWTQPNGACGVGFLDKNAERVFVRICALHYATYGSLK